MAAAELQEVALEAGPFPRVPEYDGLVAGSPIADNKRPVLGTCSNCGCALADHEEHFGLLGGLYCRICTRVCPRGSR